MTLPNPVSTRIFDLARALEYVRRAIAIDDTALAILAGARVRTAVLELERLYVELAGEDREEADVMITYVRARASEVLASAPSQLPGITAVHDFLARFRAL
jgi:hypothetical protein